MNEEERLALAISRTQVLRAPRQSLATFGVTDISYYLLTHPSYAVENDVETVVRTGRVIADRPHIVTPYYLSRLDGFSMDARRYFQKLIEEHGADSPGIYYTYRNEPKGTDIVSDGLKTVLDRINAEIDGRHDHLATIIKGEDTLWDVSLMKFIFEMTTASLGNNLAELHSHGLLDVKDGVPAEARLNIEEMFKKLREGRLEPHELQRELERWGLFEAYQDRFLSALRH